MEELLSVWLVPRENDKKYLGNIINSLAEENHSPAFVTHLTLFADVIISFEKLKFIIDEVFFQFKPFKIKKTKINQSELFFKTVFIEFELDDNLKNLFLELSQRIGMRSIDNFKPHISLIYKKMHETEKLKIIEDLDVKNEFIIGNVYINAPGIGQNDFLDVNSWRTLYEKKLND